MLRLVGSVVLLGATLVACGGAGSSGIGRPNIGAADVNCSTLLTRWAGRPQRIDLFVANEACHMSHDKAELQLRELAASQRLVVLSRKQALALRALPPRGSQLRALYVLPSEHLRSHAALADGYALLGAGGVFSFLTFQWGIDGHADVTRHALERLRSQRVSGYVDLSDSAIQVLADASQDADFFHWYKPAVHAHSQAEGRDGKACLSRDAWVAWVQSLLTRAEAASDRRPTESLYWVGYALHSIQDLSTHRGMTRSQVIVRVAAGDDPSADRATIQHAHHITGLFLRALPSWFGRATWEKIIGTQVHSPLSYSDKTDLHGHGWDLDAHAVLTFFSFGEELSGLHRGAVRTSTRTACWCQASQCQKRAMLPLQQGEREGAK